MLKFFEKCRFFRNFGNFVIFRKMAKIDDFPEKGGQDAIMARAKRAHKDS